MTAIVRVPQTGPEHANPADAAAPAADQWVTLGPAAVVRGRPTGLPRLAGRITALAVSTDGQRVYAGSALGGIWYSGDGGAHWTSLDFYSSARDAAGARQHADALTVGAIDVKWGATAADDIVYVGAGEHPTAGLEPESATLAAVGIRRAVGPAVAVAPVGAAFVGAAAADPWRVEATDLVGLAVNRFDIDIADDRVVWAATSRGLYRRNPGAPAQWTLVDTGLAAGEVSDIVVVPGLPGEPERIYVAAIGGALARSVDGVHWQTIVLPPFPETQVLAATAITRVQLAKGNVPAHAVVFAIADGPRLWRIDGDAAEIVSGLPRAIVTTDRDALKPFKLAIGVHPDAAHQDLIVVGGQTFVFPGDRRQAALFTGQVARVAGALTFPRGALVGGAPPEWIGDGVPSGVQVLAWVPAAGPTHLWIGGDGGAFRSDRDGQRGTFVERNTALGAVDVTCLAQVTDADGVMIVGTRTNGVLQRRGETWDVLVHGRVGGVAIDPADARRVYAQSIRSAWRYTDDVTSKPLTNLVFQSRTPVGLAAAVQQRWDDVRKQEDDASAPASRIGLFVNPLSRLGTQRALGTHRIWYTDDERQRAAVAAARGGSLASGWVTLPSLTDPYDAGRVGVPLLDQDRLDGKVLAAEWGADDRLYVLSEQCVYFFSRKADGTWNNPEKFYDGEAVRKAQKLKTPAGQIPYELPRTSIAVHQVLRDKGSVFVGTSGAADKHHLWWWDGTSRWLDTGFAIDTPVYAIVVDPQHQHVVYVGTARGVYKGTANFPLPGDPNWNWVLYSDGLPGAACVDLTIYSPDGAPRRMLRAALAGRGVWEVLLDNVEQGPEVYLRAHGYETRRGDVPPGGPRDLLVSPRVQVALDASPDIRVWRAPGAAVPEPVDYTIGAGSDKYDVWRILAALRAAGEDVDPEQGWVATTPAAVAHRKGILFPAPLVPTDKQFWDRLLADNPYPHDRTPADHADLVAHLRDEPDRWPKGFRTSCVSGDGTARVYVTVHSRHWFPIASGTVSVALLKTEHARRHSLEGSTALPVAWGANLVADRAASPGVWPVGRPQAWLTGANWEYADPNRPFRIVGEPFDTLNPQVVTFDISLPKAGSDAWNKPGWLLLAIVLVDGDALPADTDVARLVRTDRRLAARSVRKAALFKESVDLAGTDIANYPGDNPMDRAWAQSNIAWTGMYFPSPRVQPALGDAAGGGHHRNVAADPWPAAWDHLFPDWGIAPIYWGQQPMNASAGPRIQAIPPAPAGRNRALAVANASDAAAQATGAHMPAGTTIYLDFEGGGNLGAAAGGAEAVLYVKEFFERLAESGYRGALYSPGPTSLRMREECPWLLAWNSKYDLIPANAWRVTRNQLVLDTTHAVNNQDIDAFIRQWIQENTSVAGAVLPAIHNETGAVVANPVDPAFRPDFNVCFIQDPAFPERRSQPKRIRGGRVAASIAAAGQCAIYTVRRGRPARASGALGALVRDRDADLVANDVKVWWNPFSIPAALRVPASELDTDEADAFFAFAFAEREGDEIWRLEVLRHRIHAGVATPWVLEAVPDAGFAVDPLPGVTAVARLVVAHRAQSIDVFAVITRSVAFGDDGELAVARWSADKAAWSALTPINGATTRRTNRPAAVSRAAGVADLFWVDPAGHVSMSGSVAADPTAWSAPAGVGDPALVVHPFSNVVAIAQDANRIDVLFLAQPRPTAPGAWRLYNTWWTNGGAGGGWGAPPNSRIADDGTVDIEPLASIAACKRDATHLDVFLVGLNNGALYVTTLDYAADRWSGPVLIGAAPAGLARLASVDAACSHGGGDVQVIVSGRNGNVYATSFRPATNDYGPLVSLAATFPF